MYFFKHAGDSKLTLEKIEKLIGKDKIIRRAFNAVDQTNWSEEELRTYEKITKTRLDNLAVEQQKIKDAKAEGKAEEKIELAKKMLRKSYPMETISKLTGLTIEGIETLEEE